jgi:hypothetical protein
LPCGKPSTHEESGTNNSSTDMEHTYPQQRQRILLNPGAPNTRQLQYQIQIACTHIACQSYSSCYNHLGASFPKTTLAAARGGEHKNRNELAVQGARCFLTPPDTAATLSTKDSAAHQLQFASYLAPQQKQSYASLPNASCSSITNPSLPLLPPPAIPCPPTLAGPASPFPRALCSTH